MPAPTDNLSAARPEAVTEAITEAIAEVLAVEQQWTAAHLAGDFATLAGLMAPDYIRIQPDGSVAGRAAVLAVYQPDHRHWDTPPATSTTSASTATRRGLPPPSSSAAGPPRRQPRRPFRLRRPLPLDLRQA